MLDSVRPCPKLTLVLKTGGGDVAAAYRIAKLLKASAGRFTVVLAGRVMSAGTLIALAADDIIATSNGELGPIDPSVPQQREGNGRSEVISCEDVRLYATMCRDWFGLSPRDMPQALSLLGQAISPTTQVTAYRAYQYVRRVAAELHRLGRPDASARRIDRIVEALVTKYPMHNHGMALPELNALGLRVRAATPTQEATINRAGTLNLTDYRWTIPAKNRGPEIRSIIGMCSREAEFQIPARPFGRQSRRDDARNPLGRWCVRD